jgi:CheY-like chemotaxis protein/signal transduction histidine kinase
MQRVHVLNTSLLAAGCLALAGLLLLQFVPHLSPHAALPSALLCVGAGLSIAGAWRIGASASSTARTAQASTASQLDAARRTADARASMLEGMSHDLRTPLQSIVGFADILRESDIPSAARAQSADALIRNANRLLHTIDQVNEAMALAAGTWKPKMGSVRGCLQQLLSDLAAENSERSRDIKVVCMNAIPNASGEATYALMRGVEHAIRHATHVASDGKLVISLTHIPERGRICITLDHRGHTAPDAIIALLAQHDDAMQFIAQRPAGSGCLSLALAKQHLRAHGGDIIATLRDDASTVIIDVPAKASANAGTFSDITYTTASKTLSLNTSSVRVLVVDDAEDTLRLVTHHLTKVGYNVQTATTGRAGLDRALSAKASDAPFHVMLLDMNLPDMDGASVAAMLRQEGYRGTIVAFTATTTPDALDHCIKSGCDSWLTKPIDRVKLLDAVKRTAFRDIERRLAA